MVVVEAGEERAPAPDRLVDGLERGVEEREQVLLGVDDEGELLAGPFRQGPPEVGLDDLDRKSVV